KAGVFAHFCKTLHKVQNHSEGKTSVMARPGGVFCTPFDLQNLSYTNTGGVCGVAPITSLYALRRPRKFPAICGDFGAQKSFF
ncbi:TPA: hypothetical protein ACV8EZ_005629, partial [Escherichia coli]